MLSKENSVVNLQKVISPIDQGFFNPICQLLRVFQSFDIVSALIWGFTSGAVGKNPPANAGDPRDVSSIPELR